MRKLNLKNYEFEQKVMNPVKGQPDSMSLTYQVKDSILNILFLPALQLKGAALVKQNILAIKIEGCTDEAVLEEEEYERLVKAVNAYPAQGRIDVEFIDRILNKTSKEPE